MKRIATGALCAGLVWAVGCGDNIDFVNELDGGSPRVDAAPRPDAAPTAGTCGAMVGTEVANGGPINIAGIPVIFNAADGSLIGTEFTDVKGAASRPDCGADTTITILVENFGSRGGVFTYAGVNPGDTVYLFGYPDETGPDYPYANVNVAFDQDVSGLPGVTSVDGVEMTMGCWGDEDDGLPSYFLFNNIDPCNLGDTDGDIDILSALWDNGQIQGYSFLKDVPLTKGTSMTPADNAVTMPPWTPGNLDNALLVTNTPADVWNMNWEVRQRTDGLLFRDSGDSDGWDIPNGNFAPPVIAEVFSGLPDGFGEVSGAAAHMNLFRGYGLDSASKSLVVRTPFSRTVTLDLSQVLPSVASVLVSGAGTTRPRLNWVADDAMDADMAVFETLIELDSCCGPAQNRSIRWYLMTPHVNDGSFTMPMLPADFADGLTEAYFVRPWRVQFHDANWLEYRDIVTAPGFDPVQMARREAVVPILPQPTEVDFRYRRSAWEFDVND